MNAVKLNADVYFDQKAIHHRLGCVTFPRPPVLGAACNMIVPEKSPVLPTELELDNARNGIGSFSSDQRLLNCNSVYRQLYDLPDSMTQPGTPQLDIVRHIIQHETGVANRETVASSQQSIARQLAQLAMGKPAAYTHFLA